MNVLIIGLGSIANKHIHALRTLYQHINIYALRSGIIANEIIGVKNIYSLDDLPDPIEAISFRMEQLGIAPKDLQPMIGKTNRVYEVLSGTRSLTLSMIRKLNNDLGIPAECLIRPRRTGATIKIKSASRKPKTAPLMVA